jgi:putative FmdB family regulatory protein
VPYYEYKCEACGHQFEVFHRISEKGPKKCPECGKQIKQVIQAPVIHILYSPCHPRYGRGRGH